MSRIHLLDATTSNAIAAGEVIERPMSIVKELMENSIDAGATQITIEIQDGGITLIRVRDNGCGMDEEDAKNAFICHATSKITTLDELFSLHSMGFRGEALASIAAASRVTLSTKEPLAEKGTCVRYEAGQFISCDPIGMPSGTTVEVRDLFYNLPARFKFLKKDQTEANYIQVLIERFILCHTDISFKFIKNGKTVLQSPGNCDSSSALYSVYGKDIVSACRPIEYSVDGITVKGFAGLPRISRASRSEQIFFVNQRLIRSKTITSAVDSAYTNMLMKGKYAFVILDIYMPSQDLDVNVHPQKAEVRFANESSIYRAVYHALSNTLATESMSIDYSFPSSGKEPVSAPVASAPQSHIAAPAPATAPSPAPIPAPTPVVNTPEIKKPDSTIEVPFSTIPFDEPSPAIAYEDKKTEVPEVYAPSFNEKATEDKPEILSEPAPAYVASPEASKIQELSQPQIPETILQTREESLHELIAARVIGTFCDTYILMESADHTLLMVDQHAAHEKVLYEKIVAQEAEKKIVSQPLLSPAIVSMSRSDISFIEEHSEELENLGFEISSLGDSEMAIRSVPAQIDPNSVSSAFIEMVDEWMHQSKTRKDALILSLATCACKAAVKGHDKLHDIEIKGLLEDLSKLKDPYHCPHGRPILIRISEKEIEKQFKRIV